jgi:hypothetical protein
MIKTVISAIMILAAAVLYFNFGDKIRLLATRDRSNSFSEFVSLEVADEYIVAKLSTHETFEKENATFFGHAAFNVSLLATYKYYIKLGEIQYAVEGDTLVLEVPSLYLSTPVAFESSFLKSKCDKTLFGNCNEPEKSLMLKLSNELETKGKSRISTIYEKAAKSLADNFYQFAARNEKGVLFKNIAVTFANEGSRSRRMFNYTNSYCGKESCAVELNLGKGLLFTIR